MPDDVVSWVPGPTERGTLTLVWSCVITIFACTWTVLHLNVPGPNDTSLSIALRKAKWMIINILFPEFVFAKAVCDLRLALQELRDFDEQLRHTRKTIEWTTRHRCRVYPTFNHYEEFDMKWTWEIQYPDGWYGLLYDLLRLDRPPNLARGHCPLRRLLGRFSFRLPSARTESKSQGFELRPRCGFATQDRRRTAAEEPHPESIHEVSSPRAVQQNPGESLSKNAVDEVDRARPDRGKSEHPGAPHTGHDPISPDPPSLRRDLVSQPTNTRPTKLRWTVVHSYFAQMGGLVMPGVSKGLVNTITASHLTPRFTWTETSGVAAHPIMHLNLGKDDILDKSKVDWLLKSLAILQVAWIIINVIIRHVTHLPISQLEIGTVAFAFMAILIYLANWWRPKDISQPIMVQFYGTGFGKGKDRKQSFTRRFWSPTSTIETANRGVPPHVERVANDSVWLEGDIPLLFYLVAGSSVIFGSVHCLAWDFEFPTRVELFCWRCASLASAILPAMALAINNLGRLVNHYFWRRHFRPRLSEKLRLICPDEFRRLVMRPAFAKWGMEEQGALWRMPKELRDWEVIPTANMIEQWGTDGVLHSFTLMLDLTEVFITTVLVGSNSPGSPKDRGESHLLASAARQRKGMLEENPGILEFWRDYEEFLGTRHPQLKRTVGGGRATTYLQQISNAVEEVSNQAITFERWTERVINLVSINNFIVYTAARLVILVILFTSLRAAPVGLYQDTKWSRFLPKIS